MARRDKSSATKVRPLRTVERLAILERDEYRCAECGLHTRQAHADVLAKQAKLSTTYSYRAENRAGRVMLVADAAGVRISIARAVLRARRVPADVDHIVPRAEGGTNDPANLVTLCVACHREKSSDDASRLARLPTQRRVVDAKRGK